MVQIDFSQRMPLFGMYPETFFGVVATERIHQLSIQQLTHTIVTFRKCCESHWESEGNDFQYEIRSKMSNGSIANAMAF